MTREANSKIGALVYDSFRPDNPGIVREVSNDSQNRSVLKVEWFKKPRDSEKVEWRPAIGLRNFDALWEDHLRKHRKFLEMAEKLRNG